MVWLVLAGMAACAVLAALWPLLRAPSNPQADAAANEAAFYKAQLEEIRRDVERGLLPQGEAESARAEAARRLIAAASGPVRSAAADTALPSRGGCAGRRRAAGDRVSSLRAPRPARAARRALGEPQGRAAGERRYRGGRRGRRGPAHRQARRRQGMGGDRAGLHALPALCRRGARLCRGAAYSRRRPLAPRCLRGGPGRRSRGRGHGRGAAGFRSGAR